MNRKTQILQTLVTCANKLDDLNMEQAAEKVTHVLEKVAQFSNEDDYLPLNIYQDRDVDIDDDDRESMFTEQAENYLYNYSQSHGKESIIEAQIPWQDYIIITDENGGITDITYNDDDLDYSSDEDENENYNYDETPLGMELDENLSDLDY